MMRNKTKVKIVLYTTFITTITGLTCSLIHQNKTIINITDTKVSGTCSPRFDFKLRSKEKKKKCSIQTFGIQHLHTQLSAFCFMVLDQVHFQYILLFYTWKDLISTKKSQITKPRHSRPKFISKTFLHMSNTSHKNILPKCILSVTFNIESVIPIFILF